MPTTRAIVLAFITSAMASAVPFTPLYVNPDGEPSLIATLTDVYGSGGYTRVSDDLDQLWAGNAAISAIAISSYAGATQRFGFCIVCNGSDDTFFDPSVAADGVFSQPLTVNGQASTPIHDPFFRFFNDPTQHFAVGRVYSSPSLNPLGGDHMVTFSVNGSPDTFVLGFEDWLFTSNPGSDRDYNDLVVEVSFVRPAGSVTPVLATPEPGSMLLLGSSLLLAAHLGRRRRQSRSKR